MLNKMLFVVVLFTVALFIGSVTSTIYGAWHICTRCQGNRDYCTTGNPCTIIMTNQPGTFSETKSGKYCNGFKPIGGCTDKEFKCWCVRPGEGGSGDALAPNSGC
jgi:hypothetical protein